MKRRLVLLFGAVLFVGTFSPVLGLVSTTTASAATGACTFTKSGKTETLNANCTTTVQINLPKNGALEGDGHTITAKDPSTGLFDGSVVSATGASPTIQNLKIVGDFTKKNPKCKYYLAGINLDNTINASVDDVTIKNIHRQASNTCSDGDGIDVESSSSTQVNVLIDNNTIENIAGSGIVVYGDIAADIEGNTVTGWASSNEAYSCYGISTGADATITGNTITEDCQAPSTGCIGIALFTAGPTNSVTNNTVDGDCNSQTYETNGILMWETSGVSVSDNNTDFSGASSTGIGVWDEGYSAAASGNSISNNDVLDSPMGVTVVAQYVSGSTTVAAEANNNSVEENTINDPSMGTDGVEIYECTGEAISCSADSNLVEDNTISCYTTPVDDQGTDTTDSGNTIDSCPGSVSRRTSVRRLTGERPLTHGPRF